MQHASEALLAAARSGDVGALSALVEQHRSGVYRFGLRVCPTTEDAEDAVQETLWAATRALPKLRGGATSVASWLFTMVRRRCLRAVEARRRAPLGIDDDDLVHHADPDSTLALAAALMSLEPLHREVILLRDIEELSAPEAAARLGISVDALKSRLHRARARLRDALDRGR